MDRAVKHGSCQSYFYHFSTFLKSELIRDQTSGIQSNDSCMNSVTKRKLVEPSGIEPLTSCVQGRRSPSCAMAPVFVISPSCFVVFFTHSVTYFSMLPRSLRKRLAGMRNPCVLLYCL